MLMACFLAAFFRVLFSDFTITVIQLYAPRYSNTSFDHLPCSHPSAMKSYDQNPSFCVYLQYAGSLYQ